MKFLFYLLSLVPKSLFEYLIDIYLSLGVYKYSSGFKVTSKNIEIAFPDRNKKDVALLAKRSFKESIISGYESIYTWGRNDAKVNSNILRIENNYLINNLKENGLIAVSFHNRSVDMLLTWMNSQHTTTSLFKKIKNNTLNTFVKQRRESKKSKCYETNISGVKEIFKSLKNNNIVCFAADQVPKRGFGEYIDFFNVKAYTTTLVQSLVNKTEANVMYFFIQSSPDNDINIILKRCNKSINNDSEHALLLNKDIERFIMNRPADYSWEYKRFKRSKNLPNNFYKDA